MGFIATDEGGSSNFKRVPPGAYVGRCYSLIDLGTQRTDGQFGVKMQHKIQISWELFGEDNDGNPLTVEVDGVEMPMTIFKRYTVSLHEKANLRKELASWRGRDFTDEEAKAFDVSKLLSAYCMVNVTTSENNGKTYSNVAGLTPIPNALKTAKPAPVHANIIFNLDEPDLVLFETFYDKLKDQIKASPEWCAVMGAGSEGAPPSNFIDDDLPDF